MRYLYALCLTSCMLFATKALSCNDQTATILNKTFVIAALISEESGGNITLNLIQGKKIASHQHTAVKEFMNDVNQNYPDKTILDILVTVLNEPEANNKIKVCLKNV